jgi:hypothetical protein
MVQQVNGIINGMNKSQYLSMIQNADNNGNGVLEQKEIENAGLDSNLFTANMSINDAETAVNNLFTSNDNNNKFAMNNKMTKPQHAGMNLDFNA